MNADRVERWQAPPIDGKPGARPDVAKRGARSAEPKEAVPPPPTAEQIEAIEREAREEGWRQGEAEGRRQGEAEGRRAGAAAVKAEAERLRKVLASLAPAVADLDRALEHELVLLATAIARQLLRRELRTDPGQIVAAVREALAVLPSSDRRIRAHLHPEDARIVRDALHLSEMDQPWQIIEDPTLSRGGALLETTSSRVDATVESRLNAVLAAMWGGERREDDEAALEEATLEEAAAEPELHRESGSNRAPESNPERDSNRESGPSRESEARQ